MSGEAHMKPCRWRRVPLLALVAACAREPTAGELQPFEILDRPAWSGGEVRLESPAFAGLNAVPTVLISDTAASVRRIDSVTVAVQLRVATGTFPLAVRAPGVESTPRDIQLVGFETFQAGLDLGSYPEIWPVGSTVPSVVAIRDGRLVQVDLRFGTATPLLPDSTLDARCTPVPGLSGDPNVLVVAASSDSSCGSLEEWAIRPIPARIDSGPALGFLPPFQSGGPVL
jgi:hypothetical protein